MEPSPIPYARGSSSATCLAFVSTPHSLRGLLESELKTRPRHRPGQTSCSASGLRGEGLGHEGDGGGDDIGGQSQVESKPPLPPLGWTARMGSPSRKLKQVNVRRDVLIFNESAPTCAQQRREPEYHAQTADSAL